MAAALTRLRDAQVQEAEKQIDKEKRQLLDEIDTDFIVQIVDLTVKAIKRTQNQAPRQEHFDSMCELFGSERIKDDGVGFLDKMAIKYGVDPTHRQYL